MGKPSITNIKPPSQTTVWVPPQTTWDLDTTDYSADFVLNTGTGTDAYALKVATINTTEPSALDITTQNMIDGYDYVFFGVNGGYDETVNGKLNAAGVLVTGNGRDHVNGGNVGDLIWSGNGADVDHGGGGNDIIFGENGPDQLWGDADDGSAGFTAGDGGQLPDGTNVLDEDDVNALEANPHDPGPGDVGGHLKKVGVYFDGDGNMHTVFQFTTTSTAGLSYTGAFYDGNDRDVNVEDPTNDVIHLDNLAANQVYTFDFQDNDGGFFALMFGNIADADIPATKPHQNDAILASSQAYGAAADLPPEGNGPPVFFFNAGDQLIGGNGPDQFVYDLNDTPSVDIIWDYNQGSGDYNASEGDVVNLVHVTQEQLDAAQHIFYDIDDDGNDDLVLLFSDNHAIGFVGITNFNEITFVLGAPV